MLGEVSFRDVIEAEPQPDGTVRFARILTPSGLTTLSWILSLDQIESPGLKLLLERVMAVGGNWERVFGGVLIVHFPPAHNQQLTAEFNSFFDQFRHVAPVPRND